MVQYVLLTCHLWRGGERNRVLSRLERPSPDNSRNGQRSVSSSPVYEVNKDSTAVQPQGYTIRLRVDNESRTAGEEEGEGVGERERERRAKGRESSETETIPSKERRTTANKGASEAPVGDLRAPKM
jgi:hypothetical protein